MSPRSGLQTLGSPRIGHADRPPAEIADPAIPGHREDDLMLGSYTSAIATFVEHSIRYVTLVRVDGIKSVQVVSACATTS